MKDENYQVPKLVQTARDCFEQGQVATRDQRVRNLKALRFYNDDQWPEDIKTLGLDVLRHRILLTYRADAEGTGADELLGRIFERIPVP